jgi:hypothetical protein
MSFCIMVITSGLLELYRCVLENVEYSSCLGNMITNDTRCTWEIKSRTAKEEAALNKKRTLHQQIGLSLRTKPGNCYVSSIAFCDAEIRTLRKVNQKQLGSFEIWCWRSKSQGGEEYPTCDKKKEGYWIGYDLRRQCLLKHVITEGKGKGRSDGKTEEKT